MAKKVVDPTVVYDEDVAGNEGHDEFAAKPSSKTSKKKSPAKPSNEEAAGTLGTATDEGDNGAAANLYAADSTGAAPATEEPASSPTPAEEPAQAQSYAADADEDDEEEDDEEGSRKDSNPILDQTVFELYSEQPADEKDLRQIAQSVNCSVARVRGALKRAGVDLPKRRVLDRAKEALSKQIVDLAVVERLNQTEIAAKLMVKPNVVQRALMEAGLVNQMLIDRQREQLEADKQIASLYEENKTLQNIAELMGIKSVASVAAALKRMGVEKRPSRSAADGADRSEGGERGILLRAHQEAFYAGSADAMRNTVVAVFLSCRNVSRTSQTLGLSQNAIKKIMSGLGVDVKKASDRGNKPLTKPLQDMLQAAFAYLEANDVAPIDFSMAAHTPMSKAHILSLISTYEGSDLAGWLATQVNVQPSTALRLVANATRAIVGSRAPRPQKYGPEIRDQIARRLANKERRQVIAAEMGLKASAVSNLIKRYNLGGEA